MRKSLVCPKWTDFKTTFESFETKYEKQFGRKGESLLDKSHSIHGFPLKNPPSCEMKLKVLLKDNQEVEEEETFVSLKFWKEVLQILFKSDELWSDPQFKENTWIPTNVKEELAQNNEFFEIETTVKGWMQMYLPYLILNLFKDFIPLFQVNTTQLWITTEHEKVMDIVLMNEGKRRRSRS